MKVLLPKQEDNRSRNGIRHAATLILSDVGETVRTPAMQMCQEEQDSHIIPSGEFKGFRQ